MIERAYRQALASETTWHTYQSRHYVSFVMKEALSFMTWHVWGQGLAEASKETR